MNTELKRYQFTVKDEFNDVFDIVTYAEGIERALDISLSNYHLSADSVLSVKIG